MHEVGIVENLIGSIRLQIKKQKDLANIKKVYIRLGKDAAVSEEALRFWFDNLSAGTELKDAVLEISSSDGRNIVVDALEVE